jgi:hypothetical protein
MQNTRGSELPRCTHMQATSINVSDPTCKKCREECFPLGIFRPFQHVIALYIWVVHSSLAKCTVPPMCACLPPTGMQYWSSRFLHKKKVSSRNRRKSSFRSFLLYKNATHLLKHVLFLIPTKTSAWHWSIKSLYIIALLFRIKVQATQIKRTPRCLHLRMLWMSFSSNWSSSHWLYVKAS